MSASPALLEVRGLTRRYPGVTALTDVTFSAGGGEIVAIVGANGAGKSTLMNILSGAERPSAGEFLLNGAKAAPSGPAEAQALGISTVFQEFSLVPQLSVARNIWLGREPRGAFGLVDTHALITRTTDLFARYNLVLDPLAEAGDLSVAEQQIVEIARALSREARIVIFDEPTAVLSLAEQKNLFDILRRLRADGRLILFVSHHLREVVAIADRVLVLRDGHMVADRAAAGLDVHDLAVLMVGKAGVRAPTKSLAPGTGSTTTFAVTYQTGANESQLELRGGEIVGLAGLVGAGRTTFARALSGLAPPEGGIQATQDGRQIDLSSPQQALRHGVVYLTEDRKRDGLFANLDLVANATAASLPALAAGMVRRKSREVTSARKMLERLRLVAASLRQPASSLSGGNQQKVILARALMTEPKLLVCDEPTRGVDISAKAEIHRILRGLADSGVAILVVSSDEEELLALSDRIAVMHERRIVTQAAAAETDLKQLLVAASGGDATRLEQERTE